MRTISETREGGGIRLLEITGEHFKDSGYNLKAVIDLLVGGIYYNALHNAAGTARSPELISAMKKNTN
jgi:hypothetical protein